MNLLRKFAVNTKIHPKKIKIRFRRCFVSKVVLVLKIFQTLFLKICF